MQVLALDYARKRATKAPADDALAGLYADLSTDALYAVVGEDVLPTGAGAALTAVWRSGQVIADAQPSFGWLLLDGPATSAVVRLYADGALHYTTPPIDGGVPVRIRPGRARSWEIEVECSGRITEVRLATSAAELL